MESIVCFGNFFTAALFLGKAQTSVRFFVGIPSKAQTRVLTAAEHLQMWSSLDPWFFVQNLPGKTSRLVTAKLHSGNSYPFNILHTCNAVARASMLDQLKPFHSTLLEQISQVSWTFHLFLVVGSHFSATVAASSCILDQELLPINYHFWSQAKNSVHFICPSQVTGGNPTRRVLIDPDDNSADGKSKGQKWQAVSTTNVWESTFSHRSFW